MNCKTTLGMLSAYLDRELGSVERDAVRVHLADCDACRTEERELRTLKGLLLGVRAPEPAPDFERRLMSRVREETALPVRTPLFPRLQPLAWSQLGGLAATAFLAVFMIVHRAPPEPTAVAKPREAVAKADTVDYAKEYEAYVRANDTGGTSLVTFSDAP